MRVSFECLTDGCILADPGRCTVGVMPRRKRRGTAPRPTARPQTSDQAPGEAVVQVNDQYSTGGPAPDTEPSEPSEHAQHQTGGSAPAAGPAARGRGYSRPSRMGSACAWPAFAFLNSAARYRG